LRAVFASRNPHKLQQVAELLPDVELVVLNDVAPDLQLDEPFDDFTDNALAKARAVVQATGMAAIADDSGLEVDALGGEPGVRSARFAGENASDHDNNAKLVAALERIGESNAACHYRCAAVLVLPDGQELVAHGSMDGQVVLRGRGSLGFGYDPHVVPDGEDRTMAEIPLEEKLAFSHRGRAFRALTDKIKLHETSEEAAHLRKDRSRATLEETDLDPDPFRQFDLWLRDALESESGEPNAMILATATRDGSPSARTVLLRGFDDRGFVFFTNYESRKGRELEENPRAALVFYWGILQRQVCVTGRVARVPREESEAYFWSRPRGHQLAAWASEQSRIIPGRSELDAKVEALEEKYRDQQVPIPPNWGGFRLAPDTIEFWQGRLNRLHDRLRYTHSDGDWLVERLSP
jgi:pyridoxamine 5'-phosphate oxidase